jgi:uncharacterized protein (DUF58 family)
MPTTRGWLCVIGGIAAIAVGFVLGLIEMYIIGATLVTLVLVTTAVAVLRPLRLAVGRVVDPPRLHVGATARVELAVRNGTTKTPVVRMTDHVQGTAGAQLLVSPQQPNAVARAAYRLPTERRGVVTLGPVEFRATDAFGLAERTFTSPTINKLVVFPEVVPIPPAPPSAASERRSSSIEQQFTGGSSEEFHALRIYVPGDDVRRINWPASARHDDLVVREDETPTQNHLTVLLDNRAFTTQESLDKGASVAASLVTAMRNRSDPFRLVTLDGHDTGYVIGPAGLDRALSALAITDHVSNERLATSIQHAQGAVVIVSGPKQSISRAQLTNFSRVMILSLAPSVWDPRAQPTTSVASVQGTEIQLTLGSMGELGDLWMRAITTLMSAGAAR